MDAHDLLKSWPGLDKMTPAELLAHPAWKMATDFAGSEAVLTLNRAGKPDGGAEIGDTLELAITLDDRSHVLGLSDSAEFSDLHRLWHRLDELPEALVIALVEKEVGNLLQTIENVVHRELRMVGVVRDASSRPDGVRSFLLSSRSVSIAFSLDLDSEMIARLGVLDSLDETDSSVRSLSRAARAEYGALDLSEQENTELKPGDFLVNVGADAAAIWQIELPRDDKLRLCGVDEETFTFAQFADGSLPSVPQTQTFTVFRRGSPIASAERANLGDASAIRIISML